VPAQLASSKRHSAEFSRYTRRMGKTLVNRASDWLWNTKAHTLPHWQAGLLHFCRLLYAGIRDLIEGELNLRAMSLVYTTLLSMVPLLALSFSVLKAFNVHNQVEPILLSIVAPLGEKAPAIVEQIIGFVSNVKVGLLGGVGLGLLLFTVVSLLQKIAFAFDYIWKVSPTARIAKRFSGYFGVITLGPVIIFTALSSLTDFTKSGAWLDIRAVEPLGTLIWAAGFVLPYLLMWAAFAAIYTYVPNTKVKLIPALSGAAIAAVLWESSGSLFAAFVTTSRNYDVIYSGFAAGILFLIWVYLGWMILLLGAAFSFYVQNPQYLRYRKPPEKLTGWQKERVGLALMTLIGRHHHKGQKPWTTDELAKHMGLPRLPVESLLRQFKHRELLSATNDHPARWLLIRDPASIPVVDILWAIRRHGEDHLPLSPQHDLDIVDETLEKLERKLHDELEEQVLADLIRLPALTLDDGSPVKVTAAKKNRLPRWRRARR